MHYEFVVIGGGLAGLSIAKKLSSESAKVLLLEGLESLEGSLRSVSTPAGPIANGLRLLPVEAEFIKGLEFLESLLTSPLEYSRYDVETLTYEAGGFRPFIGFGDRPPRFLEQITPFLGKPLFRAQPRVENWSSMLASSMNCDVQTRSYATRFEVVDGKVKCVWINGQKKITADQFIFTGPLAQLKNLIANEVWSPKTISRYAKIKFWTMVGLDFVHAETLAQEEQLYILDGTTADELGPCLGQFQAPAEDGSQISQWFTYLEDEEAEDSEVLAHALKKAKRQIKRAFPTAFDNLKFDRVCVFPSYCADFPGAHHGGHGNRSNFLPEIENLHFANGQLSALPGPCGALDRARFILKNLGFLPQLTEEVSPKQQTPGDASADHNEDHSSETGDVHP